jgi:nicotinamidase-related amidase
MRKTVQIPEYEIVERVELKAGETSLIVIDMQNDFVKPEGALCVPDAIKTVPAIKNLLDKFRRNGSKVFFTQDWHYPSDPEFEIWGKHVEAGTWGAEIIDELKPSQGEVVIRKTRYDGFYGTPLDEYLRVSGIKNLVITGTVANICVLHTAGSAALRFYKVILPIDAISALNEFDYETAKRQVYFLYRGILTKSNGIELVK